MNLLPTHKPLNDRDIQLYVKKLKIKNFRGVFMRNALPARVRLKECAVINLDNFDGSGSHWIAYWKNKSTTYYFDSYGNLPPPSELISYLTVGNTSNILYNYNRYQEDGTFICGQLCLIFLYQMSKNQLKK